MKDSRDKLFCVKENDTREKRPLIFSLLLSSETEFFINCNAVFSLKSHCLLSSNITLNSETLLLSLTFFANYELYYMFSNTYKTILYFVVFSFFRFVVCGFVWKIKLTTH